MSRVHGSTLLGVDGISIEVEVRISSQLPRVDIVGLPEAAVRESTARVRAAISGVGERFPERRITINLAPANVRKSGAGLDLAIAIGVLAASGAFELEALTGVAFLGELALDGRLRPVRGSLAQVLATRDAGAERIFVPLASAWEAALAPGIEVHGARSLAEVLGHLRDHERLPVHPRPDDLGNRTPLHCLSEVRGQESAKRALVIAAVGGHGLLLSGPPGSGKTMLAQRLADLLPPLDENELVEVSCIHGAANQLDDGDPIVRRRPFRAPHHTASTAGLLGGGQPPRPGEVSLAHRGVLFLDELPEFNRRALESLRQVLEERRVRIARASVSVSFPAHFQFIAAANPCPCGWFRSERRDCRCDEGAIARYRARISGPLLDRIDLHVAVPAVSWRDLESPTLDDSSLLVRERVEAARRFQSERKITRNADLPDADLDAAVAASADARALLGRAVDRLHLSARAARRILRVARTIADLSESRQVGPAAIAEALSFRDEVREPG